MTADTTVPDAWKELFLLDVIPAGGSAIAFAGMTEDITGIDFGEKDIEGIALANGGRVIKFTPMTDESITIKVYPVTAGVSGETTATGTQQLFHKQATADTTQPILVDNTITRQKFGLVFLRANTLPATASTSPASGVYARRTQIINAYMTKDGLNWDDKMESAEITFKWAPFQKDGSANKREESTDGSVQLPAAGTTGTSF